MERDELIREIKKLLQEELKDFAGPFAQSLADKIPPEQKQQLQEANVAVTDFVKKNPWAAVGIAAAAGYLVARLFNGKRDQL